ncbi:DUF3304 domain-containing protein [Enterobacter cloacae]
MKSPFLFLVAAVLLLTGCNQPAESDSVSGGGGTIEAINHTHWAINHFSVNGQSGVDIIGPWQEEAVLVISVCLQNGNRE